MRNVIGMRRETKDKTQRRAPLAPREVRWLVREKGIRVLVYPWDRRIFSDEEYRRAGAEITEDLSEANIIFGVKEVAPSWMLPEKPYVFFSHVIKGQAYNMPLLRHILDTKVSLFDYELVKDRKGKRTIAFGDFAGYAGLIDSIWALGKRLDAEGIRHPFGRMRYATSYKRLDEARSDLRRIARHIRTKGLPASLSPFIVLVTGYGRVSTAAMELLKLLPIEMIDAGDLDALMSRGRFSRHVVCVVQTKKSDLYTRRGKPGSFDLHEFNRHPDRYRERFSELVPHASMIINGIYWEPRYPKILTKRFVRALFARERSPRLRVVGDITCDIGGSIEITVKATTEQAPVFVYRASDGRAVTGVRGRGPVVLAVDKLPTELPLEASSSFSEALAPYVPGLARADLTRPLHALSIRTAFKDALIAHRGKLMPAFAYLKKTLRQRT